MHRFHQPLRVLVIDDNAAIHEDFRKILCPEGKPDETLHQAAAELFSEESERLPKVTFALDFVSQGEEGFRRVERSLFEGRPYAMAFVDVRMPPGWDGIETVERIWEIYPDLQVVICTAYSDYSWQAILERLGNSDRLLILRKPFETVEVLQLATALTEKWRLLQQARRHVRQLEATVERRTEQLRASEERYRLITENASDLIGITDAAGRPRFLSPTFQRLLGCNERNVHAVSLLDFSEAEERDGLAHALGTASFGGESHVIEFFVRDRAGVRRTLEARLSPFRNAIGEPDGVLVVARDVSERKSAEQERLRLELKLRHAQKLEAIGQLAAGIAHEINTPTQFIGDNLRFLQGTLGEFQTALTAYQELLAAARAGTLTPELIASTAAIVDAIDVEYLLGEIPAALRQSLDGVERTAHIVSSMKEFSHPGTGEKVAVNLNHAIESTLTISRNEWRYVADVVTDFDPLLPTAPILPGEINQVLLNLIVNAGQAIGSVVEANEKGTITIQTRCDGDCVEVRVQDTGPGIPDKIRDRIFEPFFTTKPPGKGTGQGLAISRSVVVEGHGGTLTFESEPGHGTVFIMRLPLKPAGEAVAAQTRGKAA